MLDFVVLANLVRSAVISRFSDQQRHVFVCFLMDRYIHFDCQAGYFGRPASLGGPVGLVGWQRN